MKKIFWFFIGLVSILVLFQSCNRELPVEDRTELSKEIEALKAERESLKNEIIGIKEDNGTAQYVITLEVTQKHYNLNIGDHIKDSINSLKLEIPVEKEFYDSVAVGDKLSENLKDGSLIITGSFEKWKISVIDKKIK